MALSSGPLQEGFFSLPGDQTAAGGPVVDGLITIGSSNSGGPVYNELISSIPAYSGGPVLNALISSVPVYAGGPIYDDILNAGATFMAGIKGKQIATGADGIATSNLADNILAADVYGRAKIASNFFDSTTVGAKFANNSFTEANATAIIDSNAIIASKLKYDGQTYTFASATAITVPTPSSDAHATTKAYVDAVATGLDVKASCRLATAAVLPDCTGTGTGVGKTLTADANGALSVDSVAVAVGNRILVKNQVSGADNGIYVVTATGGAGAPFVLTRAADADQNAEVTAGMFTFVAEGTVNADSGFVLTTNDTITVDTTALEFSQFSGAGQVIAGAGLDKSGNTLLINDYNKGVQVDADGLEVDGSEIAGTGLQQNATSAWKVDVKYGSSGLTTVDAGDTASAGSADTAARTDHQHAVSTGVAGSILPDDSAAEGTSTALARADHKHAISTAAPSVTIKTDATSAAEGSGNDFLRADATFIAATATPVAVGTSNAQGTSQSLARADHVHEAAQPCLDDKSKAPTAGTASPLTNFETTGITITNTPALDGYVQVLVNGIAYPVGNGSRSNLGGFTDNVCAYFSADGGSTARSIADIVANDTLFWNGANAGFALASSDEVSILYECF